MEKLHFDIKKVDSLVIPKNSSIIISKKNNILFEKGNVRQEYNMRSISKGISALGTLILTQSCKLDLDERVLNNMLNGSSNTPNISIRMLLNQVVFFEEPLFSCNITQYSNEEILHKIYSKKIERSNITQYSNASYFLLGYTIEKILGKEILPETIIHNIINPLGITSFSFLTTKDDTFYSASGMKINTADLHKIAQWLINSRFNDVLFDSPFDFISSNRCKLQIFNKAFYKYGFWIVGKAAYYVDGKNGQLCLIDPFNQVVIAALSEGVDTNLLLKEIEKLYL